MTSATVELIQKMMGLDTKCFKERLKEQRIFALRREDRVGIESTFQVL